ncbi:MAG: hypothetical protein K6L75_11280 [Cellvibrionaceae bacterium]
MKKTRSIKMIQIINIIFVGLLVFSTSAISQRVYFDPMRFDEELALFDVEQTETSQPENGVLFIGSSSIRLWSTIKSDLAPLTIIHRGFGGSNMRDALHHIDKLVIPYKPRAVVLYEGDNDLSVFAVTPAVVMQNFELFVERLRRSLPDTRLYVLSIKPSIARMQYWDKMKATNELLKKRCSEIKACRYIDVATPMFLVGEESSEGGLKKNIFVEDGIHMNADGYKIWTDTIKPVLHQFELQDEAG